MRRLRDLLQEHVVYGHSSHETLVQEQPRDEVHSAQEQPEETTVPQASPDVERPGWETWPDRTELPDLTKGSCGSGGGDGGDELTNSEGDVQVDGATVYKRGSTRLRHCHPRAEAGDGYTLLESAGRTPSSLCCRINFWVCHVVRRGSVPTLGFSWEHYQDAQAPLEEIIDGVLCHTRAEMVIKSFWTFYRCEDGYEQEAARVLEAECRRLLQNLRHEARRRLFEITTPRVAHHNKTEMPHLYDLYGMAHTASYKKVKAFSESDLDDPNNFTNISSHQKLVAYRDARKATKGDDFNPSQEPLDPELAALQKERLANQAALEKERLASQAALEAALEKERLASQAALDERDQTTA
ncbi:hypothetical protein ZWY2020_058966 [Hordeum vulgare]|nr:hypothetical protein ZWY2020_058966 [Hordeum vulgare]